MRDGRMPHNGREVDGREAIFRLKVRVAARCNQQPCHRRFSFDSRNEEWSVPILCLKIDVATRCNELLRHGRMPILGRDVERCEPILLPKLDVTATHTYMCVMRVCVCECVCAYSCVCVCVCVYVWEVCPPARIPLRSGDLCPHARVGS